MEDKKFHDKVDKMFESALHENSIRVKNMESGELLGENEINYKLLLFDSNLNIYKKVKSEFILVDNPKFKAVLV